MSTDQTLAGSTSAPPSPFGTPTPVPVTPDTPLDLDELLSKARLVERTARICLRGDLWGDYTDKVQELAGLVDSDGQVLSEGEKALSDTSRAQALSAEIEDLRAEMAVWMRAVRFRAMPDSDWRVFTREHLGDDDKPKDNDDWNEHIIARCAIAPTLTLDQVRQMRSKLGPAQFITLADTAYYACTIGGLDVPKSPSFSRTPTRRASDRN